MSQIEKVLCMKKNTKISFDKHLIQICNKTNQKQQALSDVVKYKNRKLSKLIKGSAMSQSQNNK